MGDSDLCIIDAEQYSHYIDRFNGLYPDTIAHAIADRDAWDWMKSNTPLVECSDRAIEEIYYFRWWIYRKHIRSIPGGFVISEFLPAVQHAGKHNTINCPIGHQIYEGRWIKDPTYLDAYCRLMLQGEGDLHQYSCWFADAVYKRYWVHPDDAYVIGLLAGLQDYFRLWEPRQIGGLFQYAPWLDGMEFSVSGNLEARFRPALNSYMYADALAISSIARLAGNASVAEAFGAKASRIKANLQEQLWNTDLAFFASRDDDGRFTPVGDPVREAVGYVPWYFNLPDPGYEEAWRHVNDPRGFCTPVGLTTAEVRHPQFLKVNPERLASWDGAIWPYATSQTLTAMQNLIRNYDQSHVNASDYIRELHKYAASHVRDGKPSISEVVRDPFVRQMCGSEHYNHSTFCDLVITGLAGIVPRPDTMLEVGPLLPETWEYFCLDGARYRGHLITIAWDRTGARYGEQGFHIYVDKQKRYSSDIPCCVNIDLAESAGPTGAGSA